jgi:Uma2 family endonuclease
MNSATRRLEGYTLADWEALEPHEGRRIELVNGRFRVNAAPARPHQRVADRIYRLLDDAVAPIGLEALSAIGLRVGAFGYIPDVVVCTAADGVTTSADTVELVVEVLSPSTASVDRLEKPAAYAAAGIPAYWLVEVPKQGMPVVRCHVLNGNVYAEFAIVTSGNPAEVVVAGDVSVKLDVDTLFAPRQRPGTVDA